MPVAKKTKKASEAGVPAFSLMVSGLGVSARSLDVFEAPGARLGEPSEAIKKAWAALSAPEGLVIPALISAGEMTGWHGVAGYDLERDDKGRVDPIRAVYERMLMAFEPEQVDQLADGLAQMAKDIESVSGGAAFEAGSRRYSRLIAAPSSKEALSYPLIGLGVAVGKTLSEGKKSASLSAHKLARGNLIWGEIVEAKGGWNQRHITRERLTPAEWLAPAAEAGVDVSQEAEELAAIGKAMLSSSLSGDSLSEFGALGVLGEKPFLQSEHPLPRVAEFAAALGAMDLRGNRRSLSRERGARLGFDGSIKRAEYASKAPAAALAELAVSGWPSLISAGLAQEKGGLAFGAERSEKLGLHEGLLAQARFGPWDKQGSAPVSSWFDARGWCKILEERKPDEWRSRRQVTQLAQQSLEMAGEILKAEGREQAMAFIKSLSGSLMSADLNFGPLGRGFEGLSNLLAGEDARLGLAQWGASVREIRASCADQYRYWDGDRQRMGTREEEAQRVQEGIASAREGWPAPYQKLDRAIAGLDGALKSAQKAFLTHALDQAAVEEKTWLEGAGMLAAWSQAAETGELNAKSIAWASARPVGASLASSDPLERLAALASRPLGLSGKGDGSALKAEFSQALMELGASAPGVALLEEERAEGLREVFKSCFIAMATPDKKETGAAMLSFMARALGSSAKAGLEAGSAGAFLKAYADQAEQVFARSEMGPADGFFESFAPLAVNEAKAAATVLELCEAKALGFSELIDALAEDWGQTVSSARALGSEEQAALALASARAVALAGAFPREGSLDWRDRPFAKGEAWKALGLPSPRLSAALKDASERGGGLGRWCAGVARALGLSDALDGNDVVAKTRDAIKARLGVGDAVWRMAIKSQVGLESLARASGADRNVEGKPLYKRLPEELVAALRGSRRDAYSYSDTVAAGWAAAVSRNVNPESAAVAMELLLGYSREKCFSFGEESRAVFSSEFRALFSTTLPGVRVAEANGARFYLAELEAKNARLPKILQEAAKRYEKLALDAQKPPKEGECALNPKEGLRSEMLDLKDWLEGSEPGVWQSLPEEPTWGQLARLSKSWHAERAATEADKADRRKISSEMAQIRAAEREERKELERAEREERRHKEALALAKGKSPAAMEAVEKKPEPPKFTPPPNKFEPTAKAAWGKIIGKHERDGWAAVELGTAAELEQEGRAMNHCVSSYASQCRAGETRIFSITLNGERKCTMEVRAPKNLRNLDETAVFAINQNKGAHNAAVTNAATVAFCQETVAAVQAAWVDITKGARAAREKYLRELDQFNRDQQEVENRAIARALALRRGLAAPEPAPEKKSRAKARAKEA